MDNWAAIVGTPFFAYSIELPIKPIGLITEDYPPAD